MAADHRRRPRRWGASSGTGRASRLARALLLAGAVAIPAPPARAQAVPADSTLFPAYSPHWSHIRISDFGRQVKYLPYGAAREAGYRWYASHVDMMEVGMDTFVSTYDGQPSAYVKSLNPTMRTFGYDYDLTICQHLVCTDTNGPNTAESRLPEEQYLHFSEDTRLAFKALDGATIDTVTIPGCPAPEPLAAASRVQVYAWKDRRWLPNLKDARWRQWYADHLLDEMAHDRDGKPNPVDGLFLDEHGPGFSVPMSVGVQTVILSGGGIREYDGLAPHPYRSGHPDSLDARYHADVVDWLRYLAGRLAATGHFAHINAAEWFMTPDVFEQSLAARGAMIEHLHGADRFRGGAPEYERFIAQVRQLVAAGGSIDLAGTMCDEGPPAYTAGDYATPVERFRMWNLASYYLVRDAPGDSGTVWFDPNLCIDPHAAAPLDFRAQWLAACERDVGQPADTASVAQRGPLACGPDEYRIFVRHYTRATVLVRPADGCAPADYGDGTAVRLALPGPMRLLEPDGSLGAPSDSIALRSAEAAILFPADER